MKIVLSALLLLALLSACGTAEKKKAPAEKTSPLKPQKTKASNTGIPEKKPDAKNTWNKTASGLKYRDLTNGLAP